MKIETKYNIGQEVWFMNRNKCESSVVKGMKITCVHGNYLGNINHVSIDYSLEGVVVYPEYSLFPTKEELIKSL